MKTKIRTSITLLLTFVAVWGTVAFWEWMETSPFYEWQQKRMVHRVLAANPEELLKACRQLLAERSAYVGEISRFTRGIPKPISKLKPRQLYLSTNSVYVEFSDIQNPFGLIAFTPGADVSRHVGYRSYHWIDGLLLFHDGQLERFGQPDGPAKGSQPFRSWTNTTSSVAGSRL